jgi:hypothetical protein
MRMPIDALRKAQATVSRLPLGSGDGYGYGGGIILTIGDRSFVVGEASESYELADEIAKRWNAKNFSTTTKEEQE